MTTLFRWPDAARVDRDIPKDRLYKEGSVGAALRRRFIEEVERVRWAYKLGGESLRLTGSDEVPEIQIFEIELRGRDLSDTLLASIDKAIPSPIIFELHRGGSSQLEARLAAARKQRSQKGTKVGDYLHGEWVSELGVRGPLPPAIDLPSLYTQLMLTLLPIPTRRGEDLAAALDRVAASRKLQREIDALESKMRGEPQFNRKVELRGELRARQTELDAVLDAT